MIDPNASHPMVLTAREYAELLRLRNAAADREQKTRRRKQARLAERRALDAQAARVRRMAAGILDRLPVEDPAVVAARCAVLTGDPVDARRLAELMLDELDPDPDAARHYLELARAVGARVIVRRAS